LKTSNRLLSWALLGLLTVCVLLHFIPASVSPASQRIVKAKAFEVVDTAGNVRAKLALMPEDLVGLGLLDASGRARTVLEYDLDGSTGLSLFDPNGNERAVISLLADGIPRLKLTDAYGNSLWDSGSPYNGYYP
jgi:hypothetical protein